MLYQDSKFLFVVLVPLKVKRKRKNILFFPSAVQHGKQKGDPRKQHINWPVVDRKGSFACFESFLSSNKQR